MHILRPSLFFFTGVDEPLGTFVLLVNPEIISLVKDVEFAHRGMDQPCVVSDSFFNSVAECLAVCDCATTGTLSGLQKGKRGLGESGRYCRGSYMSDEGS